MTAHYDHLWISKQGEIGDETFVLWMKEMSDEKPSRIVQAAQVIIRQGHPFPPNLIDVKRTCAELIKHPYHQPIALPPRPRRGKTWRKAADKCFAQAKKLGYLK